MTMNSKIVWILPIFQFFLPNIPYDIPIRKLQTLTREYWKFRILHYFPNLDENKSISYKLYAWHIENSFGTPSDSVISSTNICFLRQRQTRQTLLYFHSNRIFLSTSEGYSLYFKFTSTIYPHKNPISIFVFVFWICSPLPMPILTHKTSAFLLP